MDSTTSLPEHVRWSITLLWAALAAGILLQLQYADWDLEQVARTLAGGLILVFGMYAYLTVGISKGRRSALWIYLLLFVGGLVLSPPSIVEFEIRPVVFSAELGQVLAQLAAFALLFTPQARAWFKSAGRRTGAAQRGP